MWGKKYKAVEYCKGQAKDSVGVLTSIIANNCPQRALHMNTKQISHFQGLLWTFIIIILKYVSSASCCHGC